MGKLATIILKQFGFKRASKMAKRFGLTPQDIQAAANKQRSKMFEARFPSGRQPGNPYSRINIPEETLWPGRPAATFAQRKAARVAAPTTRRALENYRRRMADRHRGGQAGIDELKRNPRPRDIKPGYGIGDVNVSHMPGAAVQSPTRGLVRMENRAQQKNIDKLIAKASRLSGKSPKEFMRPPYSKKDMMFMLALLGTGGGMLNITRNMPEPGLDEEQLMGGR